MSLKKIKNDRARRRVFIPAVLVISFLLNIFPAYAAWDGYVGEDITRAELFNFNNRIAIRDTNGTAETSPVRDGNKYSIGWKDMNAVTAIYIAGVPADWSGYDYLELWIYSEEATGDQICVLAETDRGAENTLNYYYSKVTIDWKGWRKVSVSLPDMTIARNADWSKVIRVRLTSSGWDMNPNGCTSSIYIGGAAIKQSDGTSLEALYDEDTINRAYAAVSGGAAIYGGSPNVVVTGGEVKKISESDISICPYQINNTLMAPACFFEAYMGAKIQESEGGFAAVLGENAVRGKINEKDYLCGEEQLSFTEAPRKIDGRLYLPAAELVAALGWYAAEDRALVAVSPEEAVKALERPFGINELTEVIAYKAAHKRLDVSSLSSDDCKAVKDRWRYEVVGSEEDNDMSNPHIAAKIKSVNNAGQKAWAAMIETAGQTELFSGDKSTETADMTAAYNKLYQMALAYGTYGAELYHNEDLKNDIMYGVQWLYENRYGPKEIDGTGWHSTSGYNWWDWKIGVPGKLIPILLILEDEFTGQQLKNYLSLFDKLVPVPYGMGSNALNTAKLAVGSALLQNDFKKVIKMQSAVESAYLYVDNGRENGEGFYTDGSYVFHTAHPMNGTYGLEQFQLIGPFLSMFAGTAFEVTTPQKDNMIEWVYNAFDPLVYQGAMFRMVKGRYPAGMHSTGTSLLGAMLDSLDFFKAEDRARVKAIIKEQAAEDTTVDFYTALTLPQVLRLVKILNDDSVPARENQIANHVYYNEDKVAHQRGNFAFGLSMSSSRIFNYESINSCNLTGWYISDGMTEYYTDGNFLQSSDAYWNNVNPYRIPGTTVDTQERKAVSIAQRNEYLSGKDFVGAVSLDKTYAAAAMWLEAFHNETESGSSLAEYGGAAPAHDSNLEAKKAWFMFDDEVVCLGAGVHASNGFEVLTVVDNKLAAKTKRRSDAEESTSYAIKNVVASETPEEANVAGNTIDDDYSTKWAGQMDAAITFDLGKDEKLGFIALAFQNGSVRTQSFDIDVSSDGKAWTKAFSGSSSGETDLGETFSLGGTAGRYVRITNRGNSANQWMSLLEADIYGPNPDGSIEIAQADIIGDDEFIADGKECMLTAEDTDLTGTKWAHYENVGGYYFPAGGNLYGRYTNKANSFMELWFSHGVNPAGGTYAYTLLPGKTTDQTRAYAENPDIEILQNTPELQVVRENTLGITGYVFWDAGSFGDITVDKPMIVMVREQDGKITVSACDPTHKLTEGVITVNKALKPVEQDVMMSAEAAAATAIKINFAESDGRTMEAVFYNGDDT